VAGVPGSAGDGQLPFAVALLQADSPLGNTEELLALDLSPRRRFDRLKDESGEVNGRAAEQEERTRTVGAGSRGLSVVGRLWANGADSGQPAVTYMTDPYLGVGGRV
jgi:hypothetical protein